MKDYKLLVCVRVLASLVLSVSVLIMVSGCSLAEAFVNVFDDDEEEAVQGVSYQGAYIDYSARGQDSITFLTNNLFLTHSVSFSDTINLKQETEKQQYFFYFSLTDVGDAIYDTPEFYNVSLIDSKENYSYRYDETSFPVSIVSNSSFFTIYVKFFPNHRSNYFFNSVNPVSGITCSDYIFCSSFESDGGFSSRNKIYEPSQSFYYSFNMIPEVISPTSLDGYDVIGIARNGVPLVQRHLQTQETYHDLKTRLDEYYGFPGETGYYYFVEPTFFTGYEDANYYPGYDYTYFDGNVNRSSLIGIARDGFPIYGPFEYNTEKVSTTLDGCRGHVGETGDEFTNTYHYHIKPIESIADDDINLFIECFSGSVMQ
tara:strand:+ start:2783 stop:3895 length:1113 start_codon:yes stop_codon:yes gene_type:complete